MVLWCLLTGRVNPWTDASGRLPALASLMQRVLRGDRPDCSAAALRADAPGPVVALMRRAWAQRPKDRPSAAAAAAELAAARAKAAAEAPAEAEPPAEPTAAEASRALLVLFMSSALARALLCSREAPC